MKILRVVTTSILAALLTTALVSCGDETGPEDSHEAILNDMINLMDEAATTAKTATDKASADSAAKKLDSITARFEALTRRAQGLGEPPADLLKTFAKQNQTKLESTMKNLGGAVLSLKENPETAAAAAALTRFQKAFASGGPMGGK